MEMQQQAGESMPQEIAAELDGAIDRLMPKDRAVIVMHYFEGHTFRSIAGRLGGTEVAWQKRGVRALSKVAAALKRRGVVATATGLGTWMAAARAEAGLSATKLDSMLGKALQSPLSASTPLKGAPLFLPDYENENSPHSMLHRQCRPVLHVERTSDRVTANGSGKADLNDNSNPLRAIATRGTGLQPRRNRLRRPAPRFSGSGRSLRGKSVARPDVQRAGRLSQRGARYPLRSEKHRAVSRMSRPPFMPAGRRSIPKPHTSPPPKRARFPTPRAEGC